MATRVQSRPAWGAALPERYELIRQMASGGMASVWCARDSLLDRTVAIKLMAEGLASDEVAVRRFQREARAAARLSGHHHVVTIYDVGQTDARIDPPSGRPFIVMERLPGGTVADALRAAPVQVPRALKWLAEAAAAIDFAHRRGVIHRDIKPSNFLLDEARVLHVADFGIALVAADDTLTSSGQLLGTAAYVAPEMALGKPATEASDRYALAVAAFELLTGHRPFSGAHFAVQARQHIEAPPPRASLRNPGLPGHVDPVLAQGMAKAPEARFATAGEFVSALEQAVGGGPPVSAAEPPTAATVPLRRRPAPPRATHRQWRSRTAALAGLAALLIGAGIAAAVAGGGKHSALTGAGSASPRQPKHSPSQAALAASASKAARTPSTPSAAALEARGHQLMLAGDYNQATPVLRQAVAGASHNSLTYAYALYDLGRSLRLSGDPRAAIPVLEQRLKIPNQTDVVRNELALALQQTGQGGAPVQPESSAPGPGPGHKPKHGGGKPGKGDGGD